MVDMAERPAPPSPAPNSPEAAAAAAGSPAAAAARPQPDGALAGTEAVSSWGNQVAPGTVLRGEDLKHLSGRANLARGLGRSYGDSSLPSRPCDSVVETLLADRILAFDPESGHIVAEAGLSLFELNRLLLRRGYFSPISPGTQFVTLGGMVASDVHGKMSHNRGCFGSHHVRSLKLRLANGRVVQCGPTQERDLFRATVGGMGLTGHILEVEFLLEKIPSPWILSESRRIRNIDEFVEALKAGSRVWPHGVGWIDCVSTGKHLGRGILDLGRWASEEETGGKPLPFKRRFSVPFYLPGWLLNPLSIRAFNTLYYYKHVPSRREGLRHPDDFFYPLDALLHWNRGYGKRGFTQYQCVLPDSAGPGAPRRFLELLTRLGGASPVCVIKDCGEQGQGMLSFPMPGISIAVDIAIRDDTQKLVDRLNEAVLEEGGRVYLTKDRFTRAEHFRRMEPRLEEFLRAREQWDPDHRISSAQSVRLFGR